MIPPDQEIYEVEKRIAERRHRVEASARATGRAAVKAFTSPWALAGVAVLGFLAAGGLQGRRSRSHQHHVSQETKTAAKAGGIASIGMAAATWFIRSQFGSPIAMAQFFLSKMRKNDQPSPGNIPMSPRGDRVPTTRG